MSYLILIGLMLIRFIYQEKKKIKKSITSVKSCVMCVCVYLRVCFRLCLYVYVCDLRLCILLHDSLDNLIYSNTFTHLGSFVTLH